MMRHIVFSVFVSFVASTLDYDWSFKKLCEFHNSQYTQRLGDGILSETGDKCVFKLPVSTANEKMATKFCNTYIPYHINEVVPGTDLTECHAEATLMCEKGWIQFYGRCYSAIKDVMTKEKARSACKAISGVTQEKKIAFLHRKEMVRHWKGYFGNVSHSWLDASEVITDKIIENRGPNLLLAFEGYHFDVRNDWVLTVPADTEASVVCEYTPQMTKAESNYLLRRYSEIYYRYVSTSAGAFVRSASARVGMTESERMADNDYCARLFKPFISNIDAQAAFPDKDVIYELLKEPKAEIIRTSVRSRDALRRVRNILRCGMDQQSKNYGVYGRSITNTPLFRKSPDGVWMNGQPADECDGASWSSGISLSKSTNGLTTMSDAKPAPILCQVRFETVEYGSCPGGWSEFERPDGQKWCHWYSGSLKRNYDQADIECKNSKSFVSGFDSEKELDFMMNMMGAGDHRVWLGAKRTPECVRRWKKHELQGGFDRNTNDHCSRERVFQWVDGVATNPPLFLKHWFDGREPNAVQEGEECVELLKGQVGNWGGENGKSTRDGTKKLNDIDCHNTYSFFCGKEAPIIVKTLTS